MCETVLYVGTYFQRPNSLATQSSPGFRATFSLSIFVMILRSHWYLDQWQKCCFLQSGEAVTCGGFRQKAAVALVKLKSKTTNQPSPRAREAWVRAMRLNHKLQNSFSVFTFSIVICKTNCKFQVLVSWRKDVCSFRCLMQNGMRQASCSVFIPF